jgi:hypothetical protein
MLVTPVGPKPVECLNEGDETLLRLFLGTAAILIVIALSGCGEATDSTSSLEKGEAFFTSGEYSGALIELKNSV